MCIDTYTGAHTSIHIIHYALQLQRVIGFKRSIFSSTVVCYGFLMSYDPHTERTNSGDKCTIHAFHMFGCCVWRVVKCWIRIYNTLYICMCTLVYGVPYVQSSIYILTPRWCVVAWWLFIYFIAREEKHNNQDLHEHQNLCECVYDESFFLTMYTKRFSIHVMSRMLISFLLQLLLLLLLLLFVRT